MGAHQALTRDAMARPAALPVLALSAGLCALWSIGAGRDVNWDQLLYHYYGPYELLAGRLQQDFFAASAQGYLNPLAYVPFYAMAAAGWHSVLVSAVLAAAHGANLWLLFLVCRRLFPGQALLAAASAALGGASAVFWAMAGGSFADPLLTLPMLAGVLMLLDVPAERTVRIAAGAGVAFGAAAALKYSNAIYALAGLWLVATLPAARLRALAGYCAAGAAAVAALAGPWLVMLYREFGNPVFPLWNAVFRSPDFPAINLASRRFSPEGALEAAAFPFRMASPDNMVYAEISAPDLRFAVLVAAALALGVAALVPRWRAAARLAAAEGRLLGFFALAWVAWLATSANGRYGLLVLLLVGPCIGVFALRLLPLRAAPAALAVLLVLQVAACLSVSPPRWFIAERWSASWFPYAVPARALEEPALYLTVEEQTMAAIAPLLHRNSSFANVRGLYSLPSDSGRLARLLERHAGHVRVLGRTLRLGEDGRPRRDLLEAYEGTLRRFGLRIDAADCYALPWRADDGDWLSRAANALAGDPRAHAVSLSLASCALVPAARDPAELQEERRVAAVMDRVERACPALFRGQTAVTERFGAEWSRSYPGLEARLETRAGTLVLAPTARLTYVFLGRLADWNDTRAPAIPACSR